MSNIAIIVKKYNMELNDLLHSLNSLVDEIDGAELSHGKGCVDVVFTDGSSVIYKDNFILKDIDN